uniref:CHAP domain-containing protein n=1 Tax=uncultured Flavobacterium sp. TaxID=165435 RepID=UPI0030CA53AE
VNEYLKAIGLNGGYAWCMAFVYWCFEQAAKQLNTNNPLVKTGGCLNQWNKTKQLKIVKNDAVNNPNLIVPGAVFIISYGNGYGHTGIVESIQGGYVTTIEGNTNNSGSREGIGVFKLHTRKINSINKGFIICSS